MSDKEYEDDSSNSESEEEHNLHEAENTRQEKMSDKGTLLAKQKRKQVQDAKKKKKEQFRSRTLGFIQDEQVLSNKKIRFDDNHDEVPFSDEINHVTEEDKNIASIISNHNEEDSDDDVIEQVTKSKAKQEVLGLWAAERKSRAKDSLLRKRNRKRRKSNVTQNDEDLDEEFLAQVDEVRDKEATERKRKFDEEKVKDGKDKKQKMDENPAAGVINENVAQIMRNNIQLVVLDNGAGKYETSNPMTSQMRKEKESSNLSFSLGSKEVTKSTLTFCRTNQNLRFQKQRSKKMKYPPVKKRNRGKPSRHFLVRRS